MKRRFGLRIRILSQKDAQYMYEWMHDDDVTKDLRGYFKDKTLEDCRSFIREEMTDAKEFIESDKSVENIHLAITNNNDIYMGTVSLKNISYDNFTAEFAITVRKEAMGMGYAAFGMKSIIKLGFSKGLKKIFWCVSKYNQRAIKFYNKNGYRMTESVPQNIKNRYSEIQAELLWYCAESTI